jgi:antirestriction protein ArdC
MPSVYEIVTEQIIKQLQAGVAPWRKPWRTEIPCNLVSKKPYRGINVFLLGFQGYGSKYWLTFNQAKALGGHVKQGEHGSKCVFWKIDDYSKENKQTGELENRTSALVRYYTVFNIEQCEGFSALLESRPVVNTIDSCEAIVSAMPNKPRIEQDHAAFYRASTDTVGIPARSAFNDSAEYYSTLFHELTHSTGHASRLGRFESASADQHAFGSESYSKEELVAELGASMLAGIAGIEQSTLENSAAYLAAWVKKLKDDSRLIVSAASLAQKAADYVLGKRAKAEAPEETQLAA